MHTMKFYSAVNPVVHREKQKVFSQTWHTQQGKGLMFFLRLQSKSGITNGQGARRLGEAVSQGWMRMIDAHASSCGNAL